MRFTAPCVPATEVQQDHQVAGGAGASVTGTYPSSGIGPFWSLATGSLGDPESEARAGKDLTKCQLRASGRDTAARVGYVRSAMTALGTLAGVRVLLVEDNADTRELYELSLCGEGAEVRTAWDAKEAIRLLLLAVPHVIVSDIRMPGTDGIELIREVRSMRHLRAIPAIAVTSAPSAREREVALAAGFHEYASKPLGPAEVVTLVKMWSTVANVVG